MPRLSAVLVAVTLLGFAGVAQASPHPLPYSYSTSTNPAGGLELEQHLDFVPVRVAREGDTGTDAVTSARFISQTEVEYGLTDKVELAWYFFSQQAAGATTQPLEFKGVKQRIRARLLSPVEYPVGLGVYFEVAELNTQIELEQKILLDVQRAGWTLLSNLWVEQEYLFQEDKWEFIYNPTLGAAYELTPNFSLGLEYWAHGSFDKPSDTRHYLGPTFLAKSSAIWFSTGLYTRLDSLGSELSPGDPWGRIWWRSMMGIDL
ncbi:MAG TPA: hypothetical protein VHM70_17860 [Polyangiaceae bacterium]|jgi:hypothetical protein|nr:hypothetical protein [Polyangiaceae bacterium]